MFVCYDCSHIRWSLSLAALLFLTLSSITHPFLLSSFQALCHVCLFLLPVCLTFGLSKTFTSCTTDDCFLVLQAFSCTFIFTPTCFAFCLSFTREQANSVCRLWAKQCTGMGVQGVEGGKVSFERCLGHPVNTHIHTQTHKGCNLDNGYISRVSV